MNSCPICLSPLHEDDMIYIDAEGWIAGCTQCIEGFPVTEIDIEDYTED